MGLYKQKIFSGSSNQNLANKIAKEANNNLGKLSIKRFSDGEIWVKYGENLRGNDVYIVQSTNPPADHIIELALLIDAAKRASAASVSVVIPYLGYARQDRKDEPRVPISAKVMIDIITAAGADRIITMDLHSTQIQGFSRIPIDNLYGSLVLMTEIKTHFNNINDNNKIVVLSPDIGSNKLSQSYAKQLGIGFAVIDKRRSAHNKSEVAYLVGDIESKHVLIIDDMIDTAGTICNAASTAITNGALSVVAVATHPVLSGPAIERISKSSIDELVVTNSIPLSPDAKKCSKIRVISLAPTIAECIRRLNNEESLSALFL